MPYILHFYRIYRYFTVYIRHLYDINRIFKITLKIEKVTNLTNNDNKKIYFNNLIISIANEIENFNWFTSGVQLGTKLQLHHGNF